ncbi:TraM recognition domain-containing protein [Streptacidiphilus fuscans]|uniref:TraM recognition domain-containing protein n=1 Tax=Streptacidiphilus fuscans TaxID=2789292 RepID=A0A931B8B8_9ACTN|nr:TraM recognition domain-containing protein [Streptacidiphilus fuscans]MBF9072324.1 TraM recognition domain-containing protein [Streptacidiphilus fuscans]
MDHGHFPHPLPFLSTASAIRHLATDPNDLPGAWPTTTASTLPSALAFWLTFFAMLALVLAGLIAVATARARHRAAVAAASAALAASTPGSGTGSGAGSAGTVPEGAFPRQADDEGAVRADAAPTTAYAEPWPDSGSPISGSPTSGPPVTPPPGAGIAPAPTQPRPWYVGEAAATFTLPPGTTCVFAPEATATARRSLVQRVIADATTQPLVVVGADPALWEQRPAHRRASRFDPQQISAEDPEHPRGRWAPHGGCEDPAVATARAHALLLPTTRPTSDASDVQEKAVRDLAETLLRCWLHAAALDNRPFRHVARWASTAGGASGGSGAPRQEAVAILNTTDAHRSGEGWGGLLQAALLHPSPSLDAALARIRAALASVGELHILAACTPDSPSAALDPGMLLREGEVNSLYVLGQAGETRLRDDVPGMSHSAMPLLTALVDDTFERARRAAARSASGRIDPALLWVLDDVAAVAPFPGLPELMARGGPMGLHALAVLRSPEQARARWGERAVHSLWTNSDNRAVLGPLEPQALTALLVGLNYSLPGGGPARPESIGPESIRLGRDELLLLPGRRPDGATPQRFRIGS